VFGYAPHPLQPKTANAAGKWQKSERDVLARIGRESLYTHCVMDAFMLPVLRNKPAEIDSRDPETAEQVRVRVTPEGYVENVSFRRACTAHVRWRAESSR